MWVTFIGIHLTRERAASTVLIKWWNWELMLAINFGNPCTNGNYTMMTSPNGNIFRVTGPLCGEFTGPGEFPTQRPVTPSFDAFFDLRLNKRLSKQPWGWWFETPSWSLWRQCNAVGGQHFVYLLQLSLWFCSWLIMFRGVEWEIDNPLVIFVINGFIFSRR